MNFLASISCCLGEVRDERVLCNDLKINITIFGSAREPPYHIIDLGCTCRVERVTGDFTAEDDDGVYGDCKCDEGQGIIGCLWMEPEVRTCLSPPSRGTGLRGDS